MNSFIGNPPECLIRAYKNHEIGVGHTILGRLLSDARILGVWKELGKRAHSDADWMRIWREIAYAKHLSNKAKQSSKRRQDISDDFKSLANKFGGLAKTVEGGPLDVLAFELFPDDVLGALHTDISAFRNDAHDILCAWPSASELLRELETNALKHADAAMKIRRANERQKGNPEARIFAVHLAVSFQSMFGKWMYGTVGAITTVALNLDIDLTKSNVQGYVKRTTV